MHRWMPWCKSCLVDADVVVVVCVFLLMCPCVLCYASSPLLSCLFLCVSRQLDPSSTPVDSNPLANYDGTSPPSRVPLPYTCHVYIPGRDHDTQANGSRTRRRAKQHE